MLRNLKSRQQRASPLPLSWYQVYPKFLSPDERHGLEKDRFKVKKVMQLAVEKVRKDQIKTKENELFLEQQQRQAERSFEQELR